MTDDSVQCKLAFPTPGVGTVWYVPLWTKNAINDGHYILPECPRKAHTHC